MASKKAENSKKGKNKMKKTESKKKKNDPHSRKRLNSPGVRLIGGRIYDSENGKSCHQCRQKTMDFVVSCNAHIGNKQCTSYFCHKCLLNRYGEKAEEVAKLADWKCPKCRGVCNCSNCLKKLGFYPTGILVHTAKANGFSSVSDMLIINDPFKPKKEEGSLLNKPSASNEESAVGSKRRRVKMEGLHGESDSKCQSRAFKIKGSEKETRNTKLEKLRKSNQIDKSLDKSKYDGVSIEKISTKKCRTPKEVPNKKEMSYGRAVGGRLIRTTSQVLVLNTVSKKSSKIEASETDMANNNAAAESKSVDEFHKFKKNTLQVDGKDSVVEIALPRGIELTSLDNIDIPAEDIGHALQFLEFCEAFGQVFDIKKGQPALLLQEIARDQSSRQKHNPLIVQFHIKLLSMIQGNSGKEYSSLKTGGRNFWLEALKKCISESQYPSKELLLDCFVVDLDGYEQLNSSKKLRLLNFLCDEALGTSELRSWIDQQNSEFEMEKKAKEKDLAKKEKEKNMKKKKKLQDEVASAILVKNGVPLSIYEHKNLVLKVKAEAAKKLEETNIGTKKLQRSDAVRSEPILLDANGRIFWKLRGYPGKVDVLLQDVGNGDLLTVKEKWFTYDVQEKAMVEKYISSSRWC